MVTNLEINFKEFIARSVFYFNHKDKNTLNRGKKFHCEKLTNLRYRAIIVTRYQKK